MAIALILVLGVQLTTALPGDRQHTAADPATHAPAELETGTPMQHAGAMDLPAGTDGWTRMPAGHEGMPCGDQPLCGWGLMECGGPLSCAPVPVLPSSPPMGLNTVASVTALTGASSSLSESIPAVQSPPPRA